MKTELNLSDKFFRKVVADVFGGKTQEGLVHCTSRQEYDLLVKLSVNWDKDEAEERERKGDKQEPMASKYFVKNKAEIVTVDLQPSARRALMMNCLTTMILMALMH